MLLLKLRSATPLTRKDSQYILISHYLIILGFSVICLKTNDLSPSANSFVSLKIVPWLLFFQSFRFFCPLCIPFLPFYTFKTLTIRTIFASYDFAFKKYSYIRGVVYPVIELYVVSVFIGWNA